MTETIDATADGRRHEFACRKSTLGTGWRIDCPYCDPRNVILTVEDFNALCEGYGDDCPAEKGYQVIERVRAILNPKVAA